MGAYGNIGTYYPVFVQKIFALFYSTVQESHPAPISGDGFELLPGDKVVVFSKINANANTMDDLIVTSLPCPQSSEVNLSNTSGNMCVESSYTYVDRTRALNMLLSGEVKPLPKPLPIHIGD